MSPTPRRHLVAVMVLALLCSSVSFGSPSETASGSADASPGGPTGSDRLDLPVPPQARTGPNPPPGRGLEAPRLALDPVTAQQARIRVDDVAPGALDTALGVDGVTFATIIALGEVAIREPGGAQTPVRVAMVDPAGFRVLTPQITADALDLWERLASGEAVFTHEHAQRLLLQLGSHVPLGEGLPVRVGAIGTHATPPVADAIVNADTGARLGLAGAPRSLLVAVAPDASPDTVAQALEAELGVPARIIADPRAPRMVALDGLTTPENVWDRLAQCESSGDWYINTGNGYYGGLQFLPESWFMVGGTGMPHEASREEQILRAEKLLAIQGWQAWPVCSILIGLRPGPLPERYRSGAPDAEAEPPPESSQPPEEPAADAPDEDSHEESPPAEESPPGEDGLVPLQ